MLVITERRIPPAGEEVASRDSLVGKQDFRCKKKRTFVENPLKPFTDAQNSIRMCRERLVDWQ